MTETDRLVKKTNKCTGTAVKDNFEDNANLPKSVNIQELETEPSQLSAPPGGHSL